MTLDELKELLEDTLSSDYRIATDKRGQIIIYTGLAVDSDDELVNVDDVEEVSFDLDDEELDEDNEGYEFEEDDE